MNRCYILLIILFLSLKSQLAISQTVGFRHYNGDSTLVIRNHPGLELEKVLRDHSISDTIPFAIEISYCTISQRQFLSDLTFKEKLQFDSVTFQKELRMHDVVFTKGLDFRNSIVNEGFHLNHCRFKGDLQLWHSKFNKLSLWFSNFNTISLHENEVRKDFSIFNCSIPILMVMGSNFLKKTAFTDIRSDYMALRFNQFHDFDFTRNHFPYDSGRLEILGAKFNGKTYFSQNELPVEFEFSRVESLNEINLMNAVSDSVARPIYIDLIQTDISKIKLLYSEPYRITTLKRRAIPRDELNSVYTALAKKQKEDGYLDSYIRLDKEYQDYYYRIMKGGFSGHLANFIQMMWWGYGHDKYLIVVWTLSAILFFWLWTIVSLEILLKYGYNIAHLSKRLKKTNAKYKGWRHVLNRSWLSFWYVNLIFFGFHLDFSRLKFRYWHVTSFICAMHFFGLLCTAFLINYIILS